MRGWWFVLASACGGGPGSGSMPSCGDVCPDGTRRASFSDVNVSSTETVIVVERSCETACEPITPCVAPNVPRVWVEGDVSHYSCAPLPGMDGIPAARDVDLTFAGYWEPDLSTPAWDGQTTPLRPSGPAFAIDLDNDGLRDLVGPVAGLLSFASVSAWYPEDPHWWSSAWDVEEPRVPLHDVDGDGLTAPAAVHAIHGRVVIDGREGLLISWNPDPYYGALESWLGILEGDGQGGLDLDGLAAATLGSVRPDARFGIADMDGDGAIDLVEHAPPELAVWFGHGDGSFEAPQAQPSALAFTFEPPTLIDLDADGTSEILLPGDPAQVWWSQGARAWAAPVALAGAPTVSAFAALPDGDLAAITSPLRTPIVLRNDGQGGLTVGFSDDRPLAEAPLTADVDGDGIVDLVGSELGTDHLAIWLGTGTGGFQPARLPYAGAGGGWLGRGDLDGDGLDEILVSAPVDGLRIVWRVGR